MTPIQDDDDLGPRSRSTEEPSPAAWAVAGVVVILVYISALFVLIPSN